LRGVTAHKNSLANVDSIMLMVAIGLLTLQRYLTAAILGSLALVGLTLAASASAIPEISAAILAVILAYGIRTSDRGIIALVPITICCVIGAVIVMVANAGAMAGALDRDPDLSGRTIIWDYVLMMIGLNPWLGYGYGAFFYGENSPGMAFWQNSHLGAPHAHNGFLGLALDAGGIGMLFFMSALGLTLLKLTWLLRHTRHPLIPWAAGLLTLYMVTNLSEQWLWVGNEALVVIFVYFVTQTNLMMHRIATGSGHESDLHRHPNLQSARSRLAGVGKRVPTDVSAHRGHRGR